MYLSGVREEGHVLRLHKLSLGEQAASRLLLPARGREDIRPQLPGVREGLGTVIFYRRERRGRRVSSCKDVRRLSARQSLRLIRKAELLVGSALVFKLSFLGVVSFRVPLASRR